MCGPDFFFVFPFLSTFILLYALFLVFLKIFLFFLFDAQVDFTLVLQMRINLGFKCVLNFVFIFEYRQLAL